MIDDHQTIPAKGKLLLSCFSRVWLCATPQTAAHQAPPSLGFSRQEYWSEVPLPSTSQVFFLWQWTPWTVNKLQKSRCGLCQLERGWNKVFPFKDRHYTQCLKVYLTLLASLACTSVCFYTVMHGCLWCLISHWRMLSGHFMPRHLKEEPHKSRY